MAEMFGVDTAPEELTDDEKLRRFFGGAAPRPVVPPPKPPEINQPGDVTPGIGRARADAAQSSADQAMTPAPAATPTLGLKPPPALSPSQQIQAEPKLGGWRKGLETAARVGATAFGLAPEEQIVERSIPGSDANRQMRLGQAQKEETRQLGMRKTEADITDIESQARQRDRTPVPKAEAQPKTVETGDGVYQYNDDTNRYDIKVGAPKSANKPDTATENKEAFQGVVAKVDAAGLPTGPGQLSKSLDAAMKSGKITPQEHQAASGYLAANPTPTTNLSVNTAEKGVAQDIKDANTYYRWTDPVTGKITTGKGGKVPKGADAEPIGGDKDYALHQREAGAANIVQQSLNRVAQDIDEHPEIFDNAAARDIMATTLEQIDRASAGILVAGTGGSIPLPSGMGDMINTALQNSALDKKTAEALKQYIADYKAMKDKGIVQQMEMQGGRIGRGSQQVFSAIIDQIPNGKTPDSVTARRQIANMQATQDRLMKQYRDDGKEQPYKFKSGTNTGTDTNMEFGTWKGQRVQRPKGSNAPWALAPAQP
jgi:hypothetical protein